ncbi:hypothetical protein [uncultured Desulfosarcina sp.]|nr:hypothetical protein [uncultured Desulfosarcina sp.]
MEESIAIEIGIAVEIDKHGHGIDFVPDSDGDVDPERAVLRPPKA